jgi:hypothetical protein
MGHGLQAWLQIRHAPAARHLRSQALFFCNGEDENRLGHQESIKCLKVNASAHARPSIAPHQIFTTLLGRPQLQRWIFQSGCASDHFAISD